MKIVRESLITESPDEVYRNGEKGDATDEAAFPFAFDRENLEATIGVEGDYHGSASGTGRSSGKIYPGRVFINLKVLTFWTYPSRPEFKIMIDNLEKTINEDTDYTVDFSDRDWMVEIYKSKEDILDKDEGEGNYMSTYDIDDDSYLIPIDKYIGSNDAPEEEYLQHMKSPMMKKTKSVPDGFGSKSPKNKPLAWKQAMYAESSTKRSK